MNTLIEKWKVVQGMNRQPEMHDFMTSSPLIIYEKL